jgi:hypothetical protein
MQHPGHVRVFSFPARPKNRSCNPGLASLSPRDKGLAEREVFWGKGDPRVMIIIIHSLPMLHFSACILQSLFTYPRLRSTSFN